MLTEAARAAVEKVDLQKSSVKVWVRACDPGQRDEIVGAVTAHLTSMEVNMAKAGELPGGPA